MAKYGAQILKATTSTTIGVASLECPSSSARRIKLLELELGSDAATLGTSNFRFDLNRTTTAATGTTFTPTLIDPGDSVAAVSLVKNNLTIQGTNTSGAIPLTIALNQQASFRWVANPGCEIVIPATASNGLCINTPVAAGSPSFAGSLMFEE